MSIDNRMLPAHLIRLYVWELLQRNTAITKVNGEVPIIPINDEAKFADSNKPYIIYGFSETDRGDKQVNDGVISFRIIGETYAQINHFANVIQRTFEDWFIADSVNNWTTNQDIDMIGIRFTDFSVSYLEGGDAPGDEGGRRESVINISYGYVADYKVKRYEFDGNEWIWR